MTERGRRAARFIAEACLRLKAGEQFLAIVDDMARPRWMGELVAEAVAGLGAQSTVVVIPPGLPGSQEPPPALAGAIKAANAMIHFSGGNELFHTNAVKEALAAGSRFYAMTGLSEAEFERELSLADLEEVAARTSEVASVLEKATHVRMTSPLGSDLTLRLGGRPAHRIHPLHPRNGILPTYAEAAVSPLEGTAEGVVALTQVLGWDYVFEQPLRVRVSGGRAVDLDGDPDDVARLAELIDTDENARNFPAEFAFGTSHLVRKGLRGTREDAGRIGTVHLAFGRNDTIDGTTWSCVHKDALVTRPTVELDGRRAIEDGRLLVGL